MGRRQTLCKRNRLGTEKGLLVELLRAEVALWWDTGGKGRLVSYLVSYLECLLEHSVLTGARGPA